MSKYWLLLILLMQVLPTHAADVFRGKQIFIQHCTDCHGPSGEGVMPGAPNFTRGESLFKSDIELLNSLRFGQGTMPGYSGLLQEDELEDVIAYLRTFL